MPHVLNGSRPEPTRRRPAGPTGASPFDEALLAEVARTLGADRLSELLALLAVELENKPRLIVEAVADADLGRAAHEAHSLKGAAACLGARAVASAAQELEELFAASLKSRQRLTPRALRRMNGAIQITRSALACYPYARTPDA